MNMRRVVRLSRYRGFTLLEVLVALSILALAALAVIRQTGQSVNQMQALEARTVALWLAENQLALLRVAEPWPNTGRLSSRYTIAGQDWQVDTDITQTPEPWLRQLEVSVSLAEQNAPLLSLTGYRGALLMAGRRQQGLTLLEILVALSIFSVIGIASYRLLAAVIDTGQASERYSQRLDTVQRAVSLVDRDLKQWLDRPLRTSQSGPVEPALWVDDSDFPLQLTRGGWANPLGLGRSTLQRVAYDVGPHPDRANPDSPFYQDERQYLRRHYWTVLDHRQQPPAVTQALLPDVSAIRLVVIDRNNIRHTRWPPPPPANPAAALPEPMLLEFAIDQAQLGSLLRFYPVL